MTIIGSASVTIRADDKHFEPDVRRAVNKIKNLTIALQVDADVSKASKKIRDLRYRLTNKPIIIQVDADLSKAEEKFRKFFDKWINNDVNFNAKANTGEANEKLRELLERYKNNGVTVQANADTTAANAALSFAARRRTSRIAAIIDPETSAALKGLLSTLTGTLPVDKVKSAIAGVAANFEGLAVKGTIAVTVVNALSAALLTTAANAFSVAGDILQVTGLLAGMPAVIFSVYFALKAHKMAWEGFSEAAHDNSEKANEALAKLPPAAQSAALSLRGLREEIQNSVQNAYWDEVGETFTEMVEMQFPSIKKGLTEIGAALGFLSEELFASLRDVGDFNDVFLLVEEGMRNLSSGIKPAVEGLATFVGIGSNRLPVFGKWLASLGEQFGAFAERSKNNGDILRWIDEGVVSLKELGTIVASTVTIFNSLTEAARASGAPGLTEMADGFRNVADIVSGEPFQSRLIAVLEGARRGTDQMAEGFDQLMTYLGNSSESLAHFLDLAGEITGLTFESIVTLFDGTGLGSGLYDAMMGLRDGLVILEPGFENLGTLIGDLGTISGELLRNMAPGLNQLAETLSEVVAALQQGILDSMPVFNEFVQAILGLATGPLVVLATAIGNVLEAFATWPDGVQTALMSLGLLLLVGPKLKAMWNGVAPAGTGALRQIDGAVATTAGGLKGKLIGGFRGVTTFLGGPWGAALAVAAVALGSFAQANADSEARVEALKDTINEQTGEISKAGEKMLSNNLMDGPTNAWDDFARGFIGRSASVEETLDTLGISFGDVSAQLADSASRDEYLANWEEASRQLANTGEVSEELARKLGTTSEAMEKAAGGFGNGNSLAHARTEMQKVADEAARAEAEVSALADANGTTTVEAKMLADNMSVLEDATASVSDKARALSDNIDILGGGMKTARSASRDQAQSLDDLKTSIAGIAEQNNQVIDANGRLDESFRNTLINADGSFSNATQASRDFSKSLDDAAQQVFTTGAAEMKRVQDLGGSFPEAQAAAMKAMEPAAQAIKDQLITLGYEGEQLNGALRELGINPDQLMGAISVDTGQAEHDLERVAIMGAALAEGNFEIVLAASTETAKDKLLEVDVLGKAMKEGGWEAVLDVIDNSGTTVPDFLIKYKELQDQPEELQKFLDATFRGEGEVVKATSMVDSYGVLKPTVPLGAMDTTANGLATATGGISTFNNLVGKAKLEAENNAKMGVAGAQADINSLKGTKVNAEVENLTKGTIDQSQAIINSLKGKKVDAEALNKAQAGVTAAQKAVDSMRGKNVPVEAINRAQAAVNAAQGAVNGFHGKSVQLTVTSNAERAVQLAQGAINRIQGKSVNIIVGYSEGVRPAVLNGKAVAANGMILNGAGVKTMADGGILSSIKAAGVKSYANGGVENHVAQISRGQWPYRVWSEPETGGEAYLPLAKSKRPRSLKIFEEVAKIFGYGIFKKFADGGILQQSNTPAVVSSRYAPTGVGSSPVASTRATGLGQPIVVVNPSQGLSEAQIGEAAANEWYWQMNNR